MRMGKELINQGVPASVAMMPRATQAQERVQYAIE